MEVHHHNVDREHPNGGTTITLDGNEVAHAIDLYVASLGITVSGARTVRVTKSDEPGHTPGADMFVDPSGRVLVQGDVIPVGCSAEVGVEVIHHRAQFGGNSTVADLVEVLTGTPTRVPVDKITVMDGRHLDGFVIDEKRRCYVAQANWAFGELICLRGYWFDHSGYSGTISAGITDHVRIGGQHAGSVLNNPRRSHQKEPI